MSNDENIERKNVEKLEDVVNTQLTVQMCSIGLCHPLVVFTMVVHCVKRTTKYEKR
jgi:hypothetical protein